MTHNLRYSSAAKYLCPGMTLNADIIQDRFCVAGISYRKADAMQRGRYAVDSKTREAILAEAKALGIKSLFVISTCNRTEIYGYVAHPDELAALLCRHTQGTIEALDELGFQALGADALNHLFRMAAGLASQIIGDYEIQGQLKQAIAASRTAGLIGPVMDRTLNFVFQASKKIRSTTGLSTGTVSVSYAAIEWLRQHAGEGSYKALLIGTGKFGTTVCRNFATYLPQCALTVTNRTNEKAQNIANDVGASFLPFENMPEQLNEFDIIITSTSAKEPIVRSSFFKGSKQRFIVDLSIPANVEASVGYLPGVLLANVDDISSIMQATISRRQTAIPAAEAIIAEYKSEFYSWLQTYKHSPAIRRIKHDLLSISQQQIGWCEFAVQDDLLADNIEALVQKTMDNLVVTLKTDTESGCHCIQAYQHFLNHTAGTAKAI